MILSTHGIIGSSVTVASGDADALAFFTAAGITDTTQKTAVNTLVTDLKAANIWTKMKALYPFVGGTAAQHRFNLKSPGTTNADFYLDFIGGGTHSATGYLPNGTTAYADTFLIPSTNLGAYSAHLSYYSRTNRAFRASAAIGSYQGSPSFNTFDLRLNGNNAFSNGFGVSAMFDGNSGLDFASYSTARSDYFLIGNKTAINSNKVYENGVLKATNTVNSTRALPNVRTLIGAESNGAVSVGYYDDLECAFATIGDGLTDGEAAAFYNAVQAYQTTLNRQV